MRKHKELNRNSDRVYIGRWGIYAEPSTDSMKNKYQAQISRKYKFMQGIDIKEQQVIDLRRAGLTFKAIADQLGYKDPSSVAYIFKKVMDDQYTATRASADAFRQEEVERLDHQLELMLQQQAKKPDNLNYVDKIVKLLERKSKLLGLDAAVKTESTVNMNLSHEDALDLLDRMDDTNENK